MNGKTKALLKEYAARYETTAFLKEDPARFMHLVQGTNNQETMAFIAANLSYGNRKQFFPKINFVLEKSQGEPYNWVKSGLFEQDIPPTDDCYYRLYTKRMMNSFLKNAAKAINRTPFSAPIRTGNSRQRCQNGRGCALQILCIAWARRHRSHQCTLCLQAHLHVSAVDGTRQFARRLRHLERHHRQTHPHHAARHPRLDASTTPKTAQKQVYLHVYRQETDCRNGQSIP